MVKIDDLLQDTGRIDLDELQNFMDAHTNRIPLIAIGERMQEASKDKTGGLNIIFSTPIPFDALYDIDEKKRGKARYEDGLRFTQKYGKVAGSRMTEILKKLEYGGTDELFERFHVYSLQNLRSGYPRVFPLEVSDIEQGRTEIENALTDTGYQLPEGYEQPS